MPDVNFFSPNMPLDPKKALKLHQQQALADAMMKEGNTPLDISNRQIGGVAYAVSPFEGMAKMLQSYNAHSKQDDVQKEYSDEATKYQQALAGALKSGSLEGMIAASADNPQLMDFGKDLALSKAKSDYEVQKLMAIELMKNNMDPEKSFIRSVLGNGQAAPPSQQSPPMPSSAPFPNDVGSSGQLPQVPPGPMQMPPLPVGNLSPQAPPQAMGAMVPPPPPAPAFDASGGMGGPQLPANPPPPLAPQSQSPQNAVQSAMLEKYLGKPNDGMMWSMSPNGPTQVINPNAKLTDEQAKAAGFYDRMQEANPVFSDPAKASAGMDLGNVAVGSVPLIGNTQVPPEYQQFDQAQRNFVNAVLRRESGAVISPSEFQNAAKQYFPQPGDKPEVLAQKAQNRQTVMQSMQRSAGPGFQPKNVDPEEGRTATNKQTGQKLIKRNGQWVPQ